MKSIFSPAVENLLSEERWLIWQKEYHPVQNLNFETNFTLTNGYIGVRGTFEEGSEKEYPGNFIAGVFDKSEAMVRELVNGQSWLGIKIYIDDTQIAFEKCKVKAFGRVLDMKKSLLIRASILVDEVGRETLIEGYRFVSRSNVHRAGIKLFFTPLNYSGTIAVENILDGTVANNTDSPKFKVKHVKVVDNSSFENGGCYLETATRESDTRIGVASVLRICDSDDNTNKISIRRNIAFGEQSIGYSEFNAVNNKTVIIEKFVITYTSNDVCKDDLKEYIKAELDKFELFSMEQELNNHIKVYDKLWDKADIEIKGDDEADKALRFNIFHLMSTVNENDSRVSIGAKALHGEGYKGHVFWDTEIFMLPFFIYTNPKSAKQLLMYRYNLLNGARRVAEHFGNKGAEFPWESADTGMEESPTWYYAHSGEIVIWPAEIQYHITSDVAYGIYQYYRAVDDDEFMLNYGMEMMLETARFWSFKCTYDEKRDKYELKDVIGPDEYHKHIDNNCYTNYFARWNIRKAFELLKLFTRKYPKKMNILTSKLCLTEEELNKWHEVAEKMYIPYKAEKKLIEQFEGYFKKADHILDKFDENGMPLWPKGMTEEYIGETQLNKQADVMMLLYLLGDEFDKETIKLNYDYYDKRTLQKSSLSPSIFSIMGIRSGDYSKAYSYFIKTANTDLVDNQGNTFQGLHAASTGGTWQTVIFGFGGMNVDSAGVLCFNPWLPEKWQGLKFKLCWKGGILEVLITKKNTSIVLKEGKLEGLTIKVNGEIYSVLDRT